jgi:hypothetical protein
MIEIERGKEREGTSSREEELYFSDQPDGKKELCLILETAVGGS